MKISRLVLNAVAVVALTCSAFASTPAEKSAHGTAPQLLPSEFGGWQLSGTTKVSNDPAIADPVNAAVLKEYGFTDFAAAAYTRDDGRKLTIKAARFADASGAYGAFTYYKVPQMLIEKIGDQAASLNERVLFYRGSILVDAVFQKLSAMSAAELREMAGDLPLPPGTTGNLPGLPAYLPTQSYVKNSAKYVLGPVTLQNLNAPIPADLVDFNAGAEVVLGKYNTSGGEATLTLISYPTPQIAGVHLRRIDAARQPNPQARSAQSSNTQQPSPQANVTEPSAPLLANLGPIYDKRTGPIVVAVTGPISPSEAKSLLDSINYDANVTWNENTYATRKDNLANLLLNIIYLCGIVIGFALVAGVAFGGARVLLKRLFPDRVFDRTEAVEFITLHLTEERPEPRANHVSSSIKAI